VIAVIAALSLWSVVPVDGLVAAALDGVPNQEHLLVMTSLDEY